MKLKSSLKVYTINADAEVEFQQDHLKEIKKYKKFNKNKEKL
jgi:hypothetical protein